MKVTLDSFVRFRRDESGQTMVLAAIMLPLIIGFVGFAVDVSYAFNYKKQMQAAADNGAMAGATAVKSNGAIGFAELAEVVALSMSNSGFADGSHGIVVTVCRPARDEECSTTYSYDAGDGAVKVSIAQTKRTLLTMILGFKPMPMETSAVAARCAGVGHICPARAGLTLAE